MSKSKNNQIKNYQEETTLDKVLWFVETYLPQKKKGSFSKEFHRHNLESNVISTINKFLSPRSKSIRGNSNNTKVTFIIGNWALPYLNFLKRLKLIK